MINFHILRLSKTQYNQLKNGQGQEQPKTDILVFQFLYRKSATEEFITLQAYPMTHGHGKIDNSITEILQSETSGSVFTLTDGTILGDQQVFIDNHNPNLPLGLEQLINDPTQDFYFEFTPKFDSTNSHMSYDVQAVPPKPNKLTAVKTTLNPSPPAGAF